jgi:N-acetylneuraminic acid mutarotase
MAIGFSIGTKGYIGTGYDGNPEKDFWEYDPNTNTWMQKTSLPGSVRNGAVAFVIGNKAYIGTGWDGISPGTYLSDFWEFFPDSNTWIQKANIPVNKREWATAFSIGSKGYAGLGYVSGQSLNDFYEYDPVTNSWLQKAIFPNPISGAPSFVIGNNAYVFTGDTKSNFFEYSPSTNSWMPKATFPGSSRNGAIGFSVNGQGYIATGYNGDYKKDMFEYFP